jgi:predicted dienelactone hydrolase
MNSLDILILVMLAVTTCHILFSSNGANAVLTASIIVLVLLTLIQIFWKGFYWHYIPAYLQICFLITITYARKPDKVLHQRILNIGLGFLLIVSLIPWATFLPVPALIEPSGKYTVGTEIFRWIDSARTEPITKDLFDKRNVIVQAWYPAQPDVKGVHSLYMDGLPDLPPKVGPIPSFLLAQYDQIDTYAVTNATPAEARKKWPVVLFLTGNGAARAFYTSLAAGLASHGYVVLCMDHPYEASITELADGKLATTIENHQKGDPDLMKFMKNRLDTRVADVQFVLTQLEKQNSLDSGLFSAIDLNRIGIAGHSLGGATGAVAMARDSRIKAAVNIDGTLYGTLPEPNGPHPFLLLESNKSEPGHFVRYEAGNQLLFKQFGGGYRYEITAADHYSFTDAPLLFALPTRYVAGNLLHFGNMAKQSHIISISLLDAFFDHAFNGKPFHVNTASSLYQGVVHKQVGR